jgi:hypothetical protein
MNWKTISEVCRYDMEGSAIKTQNSDSHHNSGGASYRLLGNLGFVASPAT